MSHQVDLPADAPRQGAFEAEDGRSLGEVMGDLTKDVSTLMQQEVALAKAELRQSGQRAGKGIGLFAGAAVAGLLFLVFLSVSAWWGLGQFIGNEWSALVVAAVWVVIAIILALAGQEGDEANPRNPGHHRHPGQGPQRTERSGGTEPMTTSSDPDEIRAEIERTRAALSDDVDALTDAANPKNIAKRQADKAKDAVTGVKDRVMGVADDVKDKVMGAGEDVKDKVTGTGSDAAGAARDKASAVGGRRGRAGLSGRRCCLRCAGGSEGQDPGQPPGGGSDRLRRRAAHLGLIPSTPEGAGRGLRAAGQPRAAEGEGDGGGPGDRREPQGSGAGGGGVGQGHRHRGRGERQG